MNGVKYIIFFAAITLAVTAVPFKSTRNRYANRNVNVHRCQTEPKRQILNRNVNVHRCQKEPKRQILSDRSFRLPNDTEPVSYNIRLSTEIHRGDFGFDGDVSINIRVLETTNNITLHSRQTLIERIDLFNPNGTLYQGNAFYTYDSEVEFLVILVNEELQVGQELTIEISYFGLLRPELMGFFRTSYVNPISNETKWLATTQFQPINARQAFPCYDEIRYRRPINLQIRHHQNYSAISNTPVVNFTLDGEYVTTVFEETPPIPVFVLAFTVSDFDYVENSDSDLKLRVYARPSAIAAGQADDALRLGELMLRKMEEFFNISYTLPKSDQVAIPEFASDGALNWGLITHREDIILQLNNDSNALYIREVRTAHEYAHIFFANLVSPSSWAYLWLNEGLATLFENILVDYLFINMRNRWTNFLMLHYDTAHTTDIMGALPALNDYVETPEEIRGKFDFVTYNKAAFLLRMFGAAIHPPTFFKANSYYLLDKQMQSASPDDYYAGIQRAYDEVFPNRDLNFTELMSPWFDNAGYPIVTVSRSEEGLTVTQAGFRTVHNEIFPIPITFATPNELDFDDVTPAVWMTSSRIGIPRDNDYKAFTDDDWVIFNLRDSAYYITNYDDNLWDVNVDALKTYHGDIHFLTRGKLFSDFYRFIEQDFNIRATFLVRMMESLPLEIVPHVWSRAAMALGIIELRLRGTELHSQYLLFLQYIMSEVHGMSFYDVAATDTVNEWSCLSGVEGCLYDALNVLIEVMETGETSFAYDYQCNGLMSASEAIWTRFYFDVVDTNSTEDRSDDLRDLLCTQNENLVRFYLDQALNATNSLTREEREAMLISAAIQHEISSNLLIDLIEENNEEINEITSISNLIFELAEVTNTNIQAERVLSLLQFVPDDEDEPINEEVIVEIIQPNLNFVDRNSDELGSWFDERDLNV